VSDADRARLLRQFRAEAAGLREAARVVDALLVRGPDWQPREVLAHIALWATQATEHFRLHLPPVDYGDGRTWGPELIGTFSTAFRCLAPPDLSEETVQRSGWGAVARSGVALPLATPDTPETHRRVDDAFNLAAVELVRDRPFPEVLRLTEEAHANLLRFLEQAPAEEYAPDRYLYRRLVLVIAHHAEHRTQLEAQVAAATAGPG
jgi:hypothetical protein